MNKRVLVACEYSGTVRDAFSTLGWDAWSCDLLPTESEKTKSEGKHIMADVRLLIPGNWDLMICHPPCTYLTVAGNRHIPGNPERWKKQYEAMMFAWDLFNADIPHIAMENPVGVLSTYIRKPDQIIQPYEYGHPESKKTCLWLKELPELQPTNILSLPKCGHWNNQTADGQNKVMYNGKWLAFNDPMTAHLRSKTYEGIALAMAEQWTKYINQLA